ncbi:PP2C family serine/threonine-protein phosphatase [Nocardioides sp.]|uniref:PP2C family protein-serine/threonine phosphatase n=1 Tax=Nocardioides sp. TaxID=35761 RepID=UPI00271F202C|nr:protein phosphatase 2C domain-containing protein [Nocardioides sp.]MDO9456880.1 protein phosphatase 2C domain-containing protein [Nocardioides sp.]
MTETPGDDPDETRENPVVPAAPAPGPVPPPPGETLALHYSAISDVGRVRKDNQDSGYAGPWLLTVCDGVGGAARGDIASSTAVSELRNLDVDPGPPGTEGEPSLLDRVTLALHGAHEEIGRLVDADPTINGTSTTATVALFDGRRVGIGHVGDSRAYLFRDNEISQLTTDHTFVQSLIDEGRITEAEARVHPHRNLILKALDGIHEAEPDLFVLELVDGDRLFLCSDGACGVLVDGRLADILSMGTPDYAAVELVRASLEAGSSDNVTCIVADVVTAEAAAADPAYAELEPMLVGAAAELKRKLPRGLFRGHRSGDTGELEPVDAEIPDDLPYAVASDPLRPVDPEAVRYAPQPRPRYTWLRRVMALVIVVGILWIGAAAAWSYVQRQYYVGEADGVVVIHHGIDASLPGLDLSEVVVVTTLRVDELEEFDQDMVREGIPVDDLAEARDRVEELSAKRMPADETGS